MNPDLVLEKLIPLVDEAGAAIMSIYQASTIEVEYKGDESPLTLADLKANEILVNGLKACWPKIPILSEEGGNPFGEHDEPEWYWAVDPLDGTKDFLKRNGEFTVNVGLIHHGEPVLGLVLAPALDKLYVGYSNKKSIFSVAQQEQKAQKRHAGSWTNIKVSDYGKKNSSSKNDRPIRVASSRSHPSPELAEWLKQFTTYEAIEVGSSLKFCMVAEGLIDAYPRFGPTCIWDTAAGHAVLISADGEILNLQSRTICYRKPKITLNSFFIASNGSEYKI